MAAHERQFSQLLLLAVETGTRLGLSKLLEMISHFEKKESLFCLLNHHILRPQTDACICLDQKIPRTTIRADVKSAREAAFPVAELPAPFVKPPDPVMVVKLLPQKVLNWLEMFW